MVRTYTIDRTLLITLFLFFCLSAKSQSYIGIAGGGGLTSDVGLRAALVGEIPIKSFWAIQTEAAFIQRANWEIIRRLDEGKDYRQVMLSYVELPVMSKMELNLKAVRLYALLGVKVGYALNMQANFVEDGIINAERLSFDETQIDRFDFGLSLGVTGAQRDCQQQRQMQRHIDATVLGRTVMSAPGTAMRASLAGFAMMTVQEEDLQKDQCDSGNDQPEAEVAQTGRQLELQSVFVG